MLFDVRVAPKPIVALLVLFSAGCSTGSTDRFVPKSTTARAALEAVLQAWKDGRPLSRIESHKPPIEVVDSIRKDGQALSSFEITGDETNAEGHHRFTVKLTLAQPGGTEEAAFVVLGQDPLWVYREEDYKKLSGS